jgi:hypothetical protein
MKKIALMLLAGLLVGSVSGCSSSVSASQPSPSVSATEKNPYGGFPVDPPSDKDVILTVTGVKTINYTMPALKALVQTTSTIQEPFVNKQQQFTGVELATLFAASGIAPADKVATIALNDYKYVDTASAFTASNGILALSRDGGLIGMDQGGPIRIVFPDGQKYSTFLDAWNWSLRTIEVVKK